MRRASVAMQRGCSARLWHGRSWHNMLFLFPFPESSLLPAVHAKDPCGEHSGKILSHPALAAVMVARFLEIASSPTAKLRCIRKAVPALVSLSYCDSLQFGFYLGLYPLQKWMQEVTSLKNPL